jgi:hypothetical protein
VQVQGRGGGAMGEFGKGPHCHDRRHHRTEIGTFNPLPTPHSRAYAMLIAPMLWRSWESKRRAGEADVGTPWPMMGWTLTLPLLGSRGCQRKSWVLL